MTNPVLPGKYTGKTVRGSDGRVVRLKERAAICHRCSEEFVSTMTTRPRKYCDKCAIILADEARVRNNEAGKARKERMKQGTNQPRPQRLIRYAGYDVTERHLEDRDDAETT